MIFRHIQILMSILLICTFAAPVSAEVFGSYDGLEKQVAESTDIIVLQILPSPPAKPGDYFNIAHNRVGVINPEPVKIIGSIKGDRFEAGTTRTIGLGSFGFQKFNKSPTTVPQAAVQETWPKPGDSIYLVFMDQEKTINRELNMLHVKTKGPYTRQPNETIAQAVTRLTGLEK